MEKHVYRFAFILFLLFPLGLNAFSEENSAKRNDIKILFIGNSHLYFNSTPELVKAMAEKKFPKQKIITKLISDGGMTLEQHYKNDDALEAIRSERWDYVVLQEQGNLGSGVFIDNKKYFGGPELFFEYSRKFNKEINKIGAKTLFLMTWSADGEPENQKYLTYAYAAIAKELKTEVIPAGLIWQSMKAQSDMNLYAEDGYHPSIYGSYLVASTIFATIFNSNPIGITGNLKGYSLDNQGNKSFLKTKLSSLSPEESNSIHSVVWEFTKSLKKNDKMVNLIKPSPNYVIPNLPEVGDNVDSILSGLWFGESRFDFVSSGIKLDFSVFGDSYDIELSVVRDGEDIKSEVTTMRKVGNTIVVNFKDDSERIRELKIIKQSNQLIGIIVSKKGSYTKYDNVIFKKI